MSFRRCRSATCYHLHQVTDFLDYSDTLGQLASRAPLVWTLHEMTPFTGGCSYAYHCGGFTRECGGCPQLGSDNAHDLSHRTWARKRRVFERIATSWLHVVGASSWIADQARRSSLFRRFPVSVIPYGIDCNVFRPIPDARRLLDSFGIAPTARVVLFVTDWFGNRRKGFDLLDAALSAMRPRDDMVIVSLGHGDRPTVRSSVPHVHLGSFSENRMLAIAYSMADVFVIPSREDNLPNTVLEAMACGTPVVGFQTGGIPDMVSHGVNGLLVPAHSVTELAAAIETLLADQAGSARMGVAARSVVEREFTREMQGTRYLRLYETLAHEAVRTLAGADHRFDEQPVGVTATLPSVR